MLYGIIWSHMLDYYRNILYDINKEYKVYYYDIYDFSNNDQIYEVIISEIYKFHLKNYKNTFKSIGKKIELLNKYQNKFLVFFF